MRVFTTVEVMHLTGVSYRQLDYWDRTGAVMATFPAHGSGTQRRYTHADLIAVHTVGKLRRYGLPLARAAAAAEAIQNAAPDGIMPPDRFLVIVGSRCVVAEPGEFEELLRPGGLVVPLESPAIVEMSHYRMERIPA